MQPPAPPETRELLAALDAGPAAERRAFAAFWAAFRPRLLLFAAAFPAIPAAEREDAVQEAVLKAWRSVDRLDLSAVLRRARRPLAAQRRGVETRLWRRGGGVYRAENPRQRRRRLGALARCRGPYSLDLLRAFARPHANIECGRAAILAKFVKIRSSGIS